MNGITPDTYAQLRDVLLNCAPISSDSALKAIFVDSRISPWKDSLPKTTTPINRVEAIIELLSHQYTANKENALVLFLLVLRERTKPNNFCSVHLSTLVDKLQSELPQEIPDAVREITNIPPVTSKPRNRRRNNILHSPKVIIAFVTACLVVFLATAVIVAWPFGSATVELAMRVTDNDNEPIAGAEAILFYEGGPFRQITDSDGIALFTADSSRANVQLIVQANDYNIEEKTIRLSRDQNITIQLNHINEDDRRVIVRALDDLTSEPVTSADVLLLVNGETYSDSTDSNGLAYFTLAFPTGTIEANLSVTSSEHDIRNQTITFSPEFVQDVRLQKTSITDVSPLAPRNQSDLSSITETDAINGTTISTASSFSSANIINETDTANDSAETAQILDTIGAQAPIKGQIDEPGDQDWYAFEAEIGQEYAIELFDVANNLALNDRRYNCAGTSTYSGLGLAIYDLAVNEIQRQCSTNGTGNIHLVTQLTSGLDGLLYLQVFPHTESVVGGYSLRILPKHDAPFASWETITHEPNDQAINAYPITLGWQNEIVAAIEPRGNSFATNWADTDFYYFDAIQGQTYVVELFEVVNNLALLSRYYNCPATGTGTYTGLGIAIKDPTITEVVRQCQINGNGEVHSSTQFTAGVSGPFYIQIFAHESTVSGGYKLRVLPKYDESSDQWDVTSFEPNNHLNNAFPISTGANNALTSQIETRNNSYSTNNADVDWYYFEAMENMTYRVELFDVANNLSLNSRYYNCSGTGTYAGPYLTLYDPVENEVTRQCVSNGDGSVHMFIEFTAGVSGTFHIRVLPHEESVSGHYSLQVLEVR